MNPKVSIIIPAKEINDYLRESVPKILALGYGNLEILIHVDCPTTEQWPKTRILVGQRKNETPPVKRDLAVVEAQGEIIAFLDDDAFPRRDWLGNALRHFEHPDVGAVYGPGVTPPSDGLSAKISGEILASPMTSWKYVYRYLPAGKIFREPNKLDCHRCRRFDDCPARSKIFTVDDAPTVNLLVRKDVFKRAGGFNTKYWPGEDTKLCLDIVDRQHKKIVYDSDVLVWHHRRNSLGKHFQQNFRYAIHRGFFAKRFPETSLRWQYFIPTFFFLFLIAAGLIFWLLPGAILLRWLIAVVLGLYVLLAVISGAISGWRQASAVIGLAVIPGIFLTHLVYGVGFLIGLGARELHR